jgi:hypothetical protein
MFLKCLLSQPIQYVIIIIINLWINNLYANSEAKSEGGENKPIDNNVMIDDQLGYLSQMQRRYRPHIPHFILPSMLITVVRNGVPVYNMNLLVELKAKGVEEYREAIARVPIILDAIICDLYMAMGRLWLPPTPPKTKVLSERIVNATNAALKNNSIELAYIKNYTFQNITNRNYRLQ